MIIKLDGKNNIINSLYIDLPKNNSIGKISESERQKIIKEVNENITHDWYNKPILKFKRVKETGYEATKQINE